MTAEDELIVLAILDRLAYEVCGENIESAKCFDKPAHRRDDGGMRGRPVATTERFLGVSIDLAPCPFCGGAPRFEAAYSLQVANVWVVCQGCTATGKRDQYKAAAPMTAPNAVQAAANNWNMRAGR